MTTPFLIELLESRIAPATFVSPYAVTYTDVDGDLVKIKSSKPLFPDHSGLTFTPSGEGEELTMWSLGRSAADAALKVKVIETGTSGDGSVNVGFIDASGVDLQSVEIEGALNRIEVGDKNRAVRGLGTLHVTSLGFTEVYGERSYFQWGAGIIKIDGDVRGNIYSHGDLDRLVIGGDLTGSVAGSRSEKIKIVGDVIGGRDIDSGTVSTSAEHLMIGGSIIGGSGRNSGVVYGAFGSVVVGGDIIGCSTSSTGGIRIYESQSFRLGGSLVGGDGSDSGFIQARNVGSLSIAGDIIGGFGVASGVIGHDFPADYSPVGKVQIEGDIQGGSGYRSGGISVNVLTAIGVNGSVLGGNGEFSGHIFVETTAKAGDGVKVRIDGNLVGGDGGGSGIINSLASLSIVNVAVGGDIRNVGSTSETSDYSQGAGSIAGSRLGAVEIGGSIIGAEIADGETPVHSYAVFAKAKLNVLDVAGSIDGNATNLLVISAGAQPLSGYAAPPGLGTLSVGGNVSYTNVNAGYWSGAEPAYNPDARIGRVLIEGDLSVSSITAGIHPGADLVFGTDDDYAGPGELTARSQIASIIVGGQVTGTNIGGDVFTVSAQRILSMRVGGVPVPLTSALDTIQLAPNTSDVLLREHA